MISLFNVDQKIMLEHLNCDTDAMYKFIFNSSGALKVKPLNLDNVLYIPLTNIIHTNDRLCTRLSKHLPISDFMIIHFNMSQLSWCDPKTRNIFSISSGRVKRIKRKILPEERVRAILIVFRNHNDMLLAKISNLFGLVK